jgi:uncharacterized protein YjbI with pentapeptide repeats
MNKAFSLTLKYLFSLTSWFLGIYIALFVMCFYVHVNESNIIANRADDLLTEIAHGEKSSLVKVALVQNMGRKVRPSFLEPYTIYSSLFGKRVTYIVIKKKLRDAIENHKTKLAGLSLRKVYLEGADLSKADMHGADLAEANLSETLLRGANLIAAKLNLVNFQGANFLNAKVYRADFREALLSSADLRHVVGLTCEQIKSAVIDESVRLPAYISLTGPSESGFKCTNLLKEEGLDLRGINLANIYFHSANLSKFNLSQVNIQNANLVHSVFSDADLSEANLQGANMSYSRFIGTNFTGTDLRGASLDGATGLTCEQIKSAVIDENTRFPSIYVFARVFKCATYECENTLNKN